MRSPPTGSAVGGADAQMRGGSGRHGTASTSSPTIRRGGAYRPVDELLPRLDRVRQTAPDRWIARCPAHDDHSPSLSLREADDGTLLVRCWAGCETPSIVHAIGVALRDLFPRRVADRTRLRDPQRLPARDALLVVRHECRVVQVIASDVHSGSVPAAATMARLALAMQRIDAVYAEAR